MADVTPTLDTGTPRSAGDHSIVTGTVACPDTNANEFVVVPTTGYVLWCHVENTSDDDATVRVGINLEDDFSTADNGTVAIQASAADTYRFTAGVIP